MPPAEEKRTHLSVTAEANCRVYCAARCPRQQLLNGKTCYQNEKMYCIFTLNLVVKSLAVPLLVHLSRIQCFQRSIDDRSYAGFSYSSFDIDSENI